MRAAALRDLGKTEARCDVWDVNEKDANMLLATLNRLRGTDDEYKRAKLLGSLTKDFDEEEILELIPETTRELEGLSSLLEKETRDIDAERGLMQTRLRQGGIDEETAELMANLYQPPGINPVMKFVFSSEESYNKAVKYFGEKPSVKKLLELIDNGKKKI